MEVDFKLIESINKNEEIKPRLLSIIITKDESSQKTKEIIILDKAFHFGLEKTEIEVFLDKDDVIDGFKVKVLEEDKLVGTKYHKITEISETEIPSVEYYIGRFIGYLFIIVEYTEINEQTIYDFENLKKFIEIDTVSKKINEGILTTEETINELKEQIAKDYNDNVELYKSIYILARYAEKETCKKIKNELKKKK